MGTEAIIFFKPFNSYAYTMMLFKSYIIVGKFDYPFFLN